MSLFIKLIVSLWLTVLAAIATAAHAEDVGHWSVEETTAPLTGARSVSVILNSSAPLINMVGQPQNAVLVLRCRDGVLAAYISWVESLPISTTTFGGRAQGMLLWRVDQQPIKASFWLRDDAGVAIGHFETKPAAKWIEQLIVAHRLVVRISAMTTQDAVFDLGDIAAVATRVGEPCGVRWSIKP